MMGKGKIITVILLAIMMVSAPASAYGFEMKGEYYEISCWETGASMFDGTTVEAGTTGQLVLSKLESSWALESFVRTMDIGIITAKVVTGDDGLNVIEYTARTPGKAQLIVVMESGAIANMGMFYVTAVQNEDTAATGWIQRNGQWEYRMDDSTYKNNGWLTDQGKWYYLGQGDVVYAGRWTQEREWWYYLDADSTMMTNTVTPGDYRVNASGVWK